MICSITKVARFADFESGDYEPVEPQNTEMDPLNHQGSQRRGPEVGRNDLEIYDDIAEEETSPAQPDGGGGEKEGGEGEGEEDPGAYEIGGDGYDDVISGPVGGEREVVEVHQMPTHVRHVDLEVRGHHDDEDAEEYLKPDEEGISCCSGGEASVE